MVGISLLTLVPGELGGSETYVRELLRGLARDGTHDYRVLLPPVAPDAAEGLPAEVATRVPAARARPAAPARDGRGGGAPRPAARARSRDADVVHYPLTIALPTVPQPSVVTLHDVQHLDLPAMFPRAERAFRSVAWHRSRARRRPRDRDQRVRPRTRDREARPRPGARPRRAARPRPRAPAPGRRARAVPPLPGARAGRTRTTSGCSRRSRSSGGERPDLRLVLTGGGDFADVPDGRRGARARRLERASST